MGIRLDIVDAHLKAHHDRTAERRALWEQMASVADGRAWDDGVVKPPRSTPVRVTVNTLRPFLDRMVAQLFVRMPKHVVKRPKVRSLSRRGGRLEERDAEAVGVALDEWVERAEVQGVEDAALRMALLFDGAAIRLGYDPARKDHALNRVWVAPVPPWEALWDPLATSASTGTYKAHLRWETLETVEELLTGGIEDEAAEEVVCERLRKLARAIPDELTRRNDTDHPAQHVLLLDYWSLCERGEERQLTVPCAYGEGGVPTVAREFLPPDQQVEAEGLAVPYVWPDGRPAVPLVPLILAGSTGYPMRATGVARTAHDESVEKTRLHSMVSSAVYRDFARQVAYDAGKHNLSEATCNALRNPLDHEVVPIETVEGKPLGSNVGEVFAPIQFPELSQTLDKARFWLGAASSESTPLSTLGQGRTEDLKYASATTIDALSRGDAASSSSVQERMRTALGQVSALALRIAAQEGGPGLAVTVGDDEVELPVAKLRAAWLVSVRDPAVAESERLGRNQQAQAAVSLILELLDIATSADPAVTEPRKVAAQRSIDMVVDAFRLPEGLRWGALQQAKPKREQAAELLAPAPAPAPAAPPAPAGMSDADLLAGLQSLGVDNINALLAAGK